MTERSSEVAVGGDGYAASGQPASNRTSSDDPSKPSAAARYRCAACGNLTRFDVVTIRRTRAFHHYSLGGELVVEDVEVMDESVEEVSCRWCGHGNAIETVED